jgi:hypothetical protein
VSPSWFCAFYFLGWSNVALNRYNCLHAMVKASRKLQSERDDDAKWMADMVIKLENERLKKRKRKKVSADASLDSYATPAMDFSDDDEDESSSTLLLSEQYEDRATVDLSSLSGSEVSSGTGLLASASRDRTVGV